MFCFLSKVMVSCLSTARRCIFRCIGFCWDYCWRVCRCRRSTWNIEKIGCICWFWIRGTGLTTVISGEMTHFRYQVQAAVASVPIATRWVFVWVFFKRLAGHAADFSIVIIITVPGFESVAFIWGILTACFVERNVSYSELFLFLLTTCNFRYN